MEHHTATVHGIQLHWVEAGDGPPVVLLHGFPEFWYSWRHQLEALSRAGLRTIALDQRGYNQSDQPRGVGAYRTTTLVADVARFIAEIAGGSAFVVGHDWGGIIAWRLAALHPERVCKLAILNAPHPAAYQRTLWTNPLQWLRSWYVLLFQLPGLPERLIRAGDFRLLQRTFRHQPTRPDAFTDEDIARYKAAFREHGITGPLNYYRAALRWPRDLFGGPRQVSVPTLVLWGERDPFLSTSVLRDLEQWVPDLRVERLPKASHWVQNDAPEQVNARLAEFFTH